MTALPNQDEQWFHLTVWFTASDATTAERAHDEALAAICEGEGVGEDHRCKNAHVSSPPTWLHHERTGQTYYLDVDYSAPSSQDAGRLRQRAIDAISIHADVKTVDAGLSTQTETSDGSSLHANSDRSAVLDTDSGWDAFFEREMRKPPEDRPTWSGWRGAYRIVTDGTDVVAEAEEVGTSDHRRGHPDLIEDFRRAHPERADVRLSSGWLIMTASEKAFGLLAYDAEEAAREQTRIACEAWIGKPVHLLATTGLSEQDWQDPKRYAIYPEGGELAGCPPAGSSSAE